MIFIIYSHFSVIILCLSGVHCISSTIENLDLDGLKLVLSGETPINEWDAAMDQNIIQKDANDSNTTVNVGEAVDKFKQQANNNDVTAFESIRDTIKTAYHCTLRKYASLSAFFVLRDLLQIRSNITTAINRIAAHTSFDRETIFKNERFKEILSQLTWEKLHLDYDFNFVSGGFQLFATHDFLLKTSKEIHKVWADMVKKTFGLEINYKVYADVMKTKFTNEYALPLVDTINELICVINEAIQLLDNFIVDNCVPHGGSFESNFESLKSGVQGDFMWLIRQLDKMKVVGTNLGLYRDFTKSLPDTLPEIDAIHASGVFVERLEFEISGLKTDLTNFRSPADIYGDSFDERIGEIKMKLVESTEPQDGVKIGKMFFRDESHKPFFRHRRTRLISRDDPDLCIIS
ncbi:uncharacterized protein LOC126843517 [Adelges cooleyi]|uniref:uncharacterized protein LOC126843517 n=1 Tax=Adelges cooleyi TaxID=133065 RepID=UPI00217F9E4F|nr:uncharacterized protein LOC126843517 [Adelges cooleyi]